jgi:hypothetical protein
MVTDEHTDDGWVESGNMTDETRRSPVEVVEEMQQVEGCFQIDESVHVVKVAKRVWLSQYHQYSHPQILGAFRVDEFIQYGAGQLLKAATYCYFTIAWTSMHNEHLLSSLDSNRVGKWQS